MAYVPRPGVSAQPYSVRVRTVAPRPYYGRPTGAVRPIPPPAPAAGAGALGAALGALGGTLGCLLCLSAIGALGLFSCIVALTAYTKQFLDAFRNANGLSGNGVGSLHISFLVLFASLFYVYTNRVRRL